MKKLFFTLFLLTTSLLVLGQSTRQTYAFTGHVYEFNSGGQNTPLEGATVAVEGTAIGTYTDQDGWYVVNLPTGRHTMSVSYTGYATQRWEVNVTDRGYRFAKVFLQPKTYMLQTAEAKGKRAIPGTIFLFSDNFLETMDLKNNGNRETYLGVNRTGFFTTMDIGLEFVRDTSEEKLPMKVNENFQLEYVLEEGIGEDHTITVDNLFFITFDGNSFTAVPHEDTYAADIMRELGIDGFPLERDRRGIYRIAVNEKSEIQIGSMIYRIYAANHLGFETAFSKKVTVIKEKTGKEKRTKKWKKFRKKW